MPRAASRTTCRSLIVNIGAVTTIGPGPRHATDGISKPTSDIVHEMKRIPIGLTEPQHERLTREARRRRVSVAALVREAVDQVFPDELEQRRELHRRSLRAVGAFHSGLGDVADRHDDYLAEAYLADLERR